tara:strand:+ start:4108 stop:6675 length:2568 start_codon:yes stop_codon:yes gene_type:complete
MAILPRYQRIGLQTRQPQQIDFAATREQARLGQTISEQVNRMSDFAFKQGAEAAEIRGQERVRDEGARPTLEAIQEGGGPSTIAERSAYALGSRVAVAEIQNEAELEISKILNNAEKNQTSFTAVQTQLADIKDGYSASLDAIDPEAAIMLQTRLSTGVAKAESRYSNYYVKLQASRQTAKRGQTADRAFNQILSDAIVPGTTIKDLSDQISAEADLLLGMGATKEQADAFYDRTYNAAYREKTTYEFNIAPLERQEEILTSMETNALPGMTLTETQSVRKSLRADYNSKLRVAQGEANAVVSDANELSRILALGGMPSQNDVLKLTQTADTLGDLGAGARDAVGVLEFNMEKAAAFRKMTPQDLTAEVQALSQGLEGMGQAGVDTLIEAETLNTAKKYLASANQAIKAAETSKKADEVARAKAFKPTIDGLDQQIKDFQALVDSGRPVDIKDITEILRRITVRVPKDLAGDLEIDALALNITSKTVEDMENMTPAEAAGYLRSIYEGIEGIGDPGIDEPVEIQTYDLAKKMLSGMEAELAKDPLSYAMRVGLNDASGNPIEITPINFSDPDATLETMRKRVADAKIVSSKYSTPATYFTPQERTMLAEVVDGSDRSQKMYLLGAIVDGGAQAAPDMLAEISKTAPEFAGIGALVASDRMTAANVALKGMDLIKGGFKPAEFTSTNTETLFRAKTTGPLVFQPNSIGITRDVATAIYAEIARNKEVFDEDLWGEAIDMALGADGAGRGGIQEVRGIETYVPPSLTADDVEVALKAITPSMLALASGGQFLSSEYAEAISGRGMFKRDNNYTAVSYGGDNYIIAYGNPNVGQPKYVFDENEELVVFDMLKLVEATK